MTGPSHKLDDVADLLAELEHLERKLESLREGVVQSHRLATMGTMASVIAHEFNNLLTPMISYCQLALQDPDDTAMLRKAVEKSLWGAQRAAEISESMLGFARPGATAEGDGAQARADVGQVVEEVLRCLARPPEKDGVTLVKDIEEGSVAAISPLALQQVLLNLVLNARQAMGGRKGRLTLRAESGEEGGVAIRVSDTGPGIPGEALGAIFEPFFTQRHGGGEVGGGGVVNGNGRHGAVEKGTGLGLAICRELIEAAGGRIDVEHTSEAGTTFRIDLEQG